jgi:hypothetical protein
MNATRRHAIGTAVAILCGVLWGLAAPAHAQSGKIGTVLGVPVADLENFRRANTTIGSDVFGGAVPANEVTVLHLSTVARAPINSAVATVSITQVGSGLKAWRVYFPQNGDGSISPLYRYINANDVFTNPRVVRGPSGTFVVQMDVRQESTGNFDLEGVRFMLLPIHTVGRIETENPNANLQVVHTQQTSNGFASFMIQLVAIDTDHARELKLPSDLTTSIQALNSNTAITTGNLAEVTVVEVR